MAKRSKGKFMSFIIIPLDKTIEATTSFVKLAGGMHKRKQDKAIRFLKRMLFWITLFIIVVLWGFGHFILGH